MHPDPATIDPNVPSFACKNTACLSLPPFKSLSALKRHEHAEHRPTISAKVPWDKRMSYTLTRSQDGLFHCPGEDVCNARKDSPKVMQNHLRRYSKMGTSHRMLVEGYIRAHSLRSEHVRPLQSTKHEHERVLHDMTIDPPNEEDAREEALTRRLEEEYVARAEREEREEERESDDDPWTHPPIENRNLGDPPFELWEPATTVGGNEDWDFVPIDVDDVLLQGEPDWSFLEDLERAIDTKVPSPVPEFVQGSSSDEARPTDLEVPIARPPFETPFDLDVTHLKYFPSFPLFFCQVCGVEEGAVLPSTFPDHLRAHGLHSPVTEDDMLLLARRYDVPYCQADVRPVRSLVEPVPGLPTLDGFQCPQCLCCCKLRSSLADHFRASHPSEQLEGVPCVMQRLYRGSKSGFRVPHHHEGSRTDPNGRPIDPTVRAITLAYDSKMDEGDRMDMPLDIGDQPVWLTCLYWSEHVRGLSAGVLKAMVDLPRKDERALVGLRDVVQRLVWELVQRMRSDRWTLVLRHLHSAKENE